MNHNEAKGDPLDCILTAILSDFFYVSLGVINMEA